MKPEFTTWQKYKLQNNIDCRLSIWSSGLANEGFNPEVVTKPIGASTLDFVKEKLSGINFDKAVYYLKPSGREANIFIYNR